MKNALKLRRLLLMLADAACFACVTAFASALQRQSALQALLLFATATGEVWFSTRDSYGGFMGAAQVLPGPGEYDLVGVRTPACLHLYVDGGAVRASRGLNLPLDRPVALKIGVECPAGTSVRAAEIGTGWPKSLLSGCLTKEEVMK